MSSSEYDRDAPDPMVARLDYEAVSNAIASVGRRRTEARADDAMPILLEVIPSPQQRSTDQTLVCTSLECWSFGIVIHLAFTEPSAARVGWFKGLTAEDDLGGVYTIAHAGYSATSRYPAGARLVLVPALSPDVVKMRVRAPDRFTIELRLPDTSVRSEG